MRHVCGSVLAGVVASMFVVAAGAQVVEMRIWERNGQGYMPWPPSGGAIYDNQLNFAVQARVVGGGGLGIRSVAFKIEAPCERDSWGTLTRLLISNPDGTVAGNLNQGVNNSASQGGLAAQFCGLAETDPASNGLINASGRGHSNNVSAQDIGFVQAAAQGWRLLRAVDLDQDGVPDTSAWNGSGGLAPDGATALLAGDVGETYFGAAGNWVDVYRFRYTKTGFGGCPATVDFRVVPIGVPKLFGVLERVGGEWRAREVSAAGVEGGHFSVLLCAGEERCAADHDLTGQVDANDLFQFINDWLDGCSGAGGFWCWTRTADLDCDGVLTAEDLFAFITRWFAGC